MNELELIDRFFRRQRIHRDDVRLAIGDDAAVLRAPAGGELAVTTDVLVAGVHFPESTDAAAVGHKALAVNLSDVAAMGAAPAWATLGLTLPRVDESWLDGFATGFLALAEQHGVELVGGDVTRGPLNIAVQLTGLVGEAGYLSRAGAREGDAIYVSGTLGDAAAGLQALEGSLDVPEPDRSYLVDRLNRPTPRVDLGRMLAGRASAAIDISDGLAADLGHLCSASGKGAVVDIANLPLSVAYQRVAGRLDRKAALSFGDDYELCFTTAPDTEVDIERRAGELDVPVTRIGRVTGGDAIDWQDRGEPLSLDTYGYQHFS